MNVEFYFQELFILYFLNKSEDHPPIRDHQQDFDKAHRDSPKIKKRSSTDSINQHNQAEGFPNQHSSSKHRNHHHHHSHRHHSSSRHHKETKLIKTIETQI